jgi:hypothetical protein
MESADSNALLFLARSHSYSHSEPDLPENQLGQLFGDLSEDQTSLIVVAIVALVAVFGVLVLMRRINKKNLGMRLHAFNLLLFKLF